MTGTAAPAFPAIQKGYQLEIANLNATGGINGRPIELITVDDKSDPATAVSVATKLITQDNVVALLGPLSTPCALAVQPLAEQYEILCSGGIRPRLIPRPPTRSGTSSAA